MERDSGAKGAAVSLGPQTPAPSMTPMSDFYQTDPQVAPCRRAGSIDVGITVVTQCVKLTRACSKLRSDTYSARTCDIALPGHELRCVSSAAGSYPPSYLGAVPFRITSSSGFAERLQSRSVRHSRSGLRSQAAQRWHPQLIGRQRELGCRALGQRANSAVGRKPTKEMRAGQTGPSFRRIAAYRVPSPGVQLGRNLCLTIKTAT